MNVASLKKTGLAVALAVSLTTHLTPQSCEASWAYVPLEVTMLQADLVVAGKIERLTRGIQQSGRPYDVGVIRPKMVLKGVLGEDKEVRLAWPSKVPGRPELGTTIRYSVGQEGVWILTADKKLPIYWATYPTNYQPQQNFADVKKKFDSLKKIPWGKAVDGLQLGMIVEQKDMRKAKVQVKGKPIKAISQLSVYPLLRNVANDPLQVVNNPLDQQIALTFKGPDGKPIDVNLYGNQPKRTIPLRAHNFIELFNGEISPVAYGYTLPMLTEAGNYSIELSFNNQRDGAALKIDNVWKGTTAAPTISIAVPAKD